MTQNFVRILLISCSLIPSCTQAADVIIPPRPGDPIQLRQQHIQLILAIGQAAVIVHRALTPAQQPIGRAQPAPVPAPVALPHNRCHQLTQACVRFLERFFGLRQ